MIDIRQMPKNGADFFLIDRAALDIVRAYRDRNISLFSLVGWLDFPHFTVLFDRASTPLRQPLFDQRRRRAKLFIDTITGFSHFPIRAMSIIGAMCAAAGFMFAVYIVIDHLMYQTQAGWAARPW